MVHAGYLNDSSNIRAGAVELFFRHRDEVIAEQAKLNEDYNYIPQGQEIRNVDEYSAFHRNWIEGILTSCLKILNHVPAVSSDYKTPFTIPTSPSPVPGPVVDPYFILEPAIATPPIAPTPPPPLDVATLATYLAAPIGDPSPAGGMTKLTTLFGLPPPIPPPPDPATAARVNAFTALLATLPSLAKYEKRNTDDYIPDVPSEEFPSLSYGDTELSLKSKQELLFQAIVDSFDDLVQMVLSNPTGMLVPIGILGISPAQEKPLVGQALPAPGLLPIFMMTKQILDNRFPKPAEDNAITNIVNYEALKRTLVKPLYLATIGVVFGSHPEGFVSKMKDIAPDSIAEFASLADPKPDVVNIEQQAEDQINQLTAIDDGEDANRNNVPINRPRSSVLQKYWDKGTGFKNEVYLRFREIASRFFSSGEANNDADDNHKGIALMCVLYHESGLDPGASAAPSAKKGKYDKGNPHEWNKVSDALIWQINSVNPGNFLTSLTLKKFKQAPVADPSGDVLEQGMNVMEQLEYYEEFLARHCAVMGSKFVGVSQDEISGGRRGVSVGLYNGPDPVAENNLRGVLRHYLDLRNGEGTSENPKDKYQDMKKFLPGEFGGQANENGRFKGYKEPRYYIQTPYDLYGFHQGFLSGEVLFNSRPKADSSNHVISYTMSARTFDMVNTGEHIPRYMKAVGMTSIDWSKVGVAGMGNYVDDQANKIKAFPSKPYEYYNENKDDIARISTAYKNRKNLL